MITRILFSISFVFVSIFQFEQKDSTQSNSMFIGNDFVSHSKELFISSTKPEFPGGQEAFDKYIHDNLRYPLSEKQKKKEGTVQISFKVERDGSITNVKCVQEVNNAPDFTTEAVRVITAMPKWTPGTKLGIAVAYTFIQPIRFSLK